MTGANYDRIGAIAISPAGEIYGIRNNCNNSGNNEIYLIDASNGESELIGTHAKGQKGASFDGDGNLWSTDWCGLDINQININNGALIPVNTNVLGGDYALGTMAFNSNDGLLYVMVNVRPFQLSTIDPSNGNLTFVGNISGFPSRLIASDIFFDQSGDLYSTTVEFSTNESTNSLYKININTLTASLIGPYNGEYSDRIVSAELAGSYGQIPTLSQWGVIVLSFLILIIGLNTIRARKNALNF